MRRHSIIEVSYYYLKILGMTWKPLLNPWNIIYFIGYATNDVVVHPFMLEIGLEIREKTITHPPNLKRDQVNTHYKHYKREPKTPRLNKSFGKRKKVPDWLRNGGQ
jgi:hypothetical protein